MSQTRLHDLLHELFSSRDEKLLKDLSQHPAFLTFASDNELAIPLPDLITAFTHTSFTHEYQLPHHEVLEFLGDSVLQLVITEELFRLYPTEKEGNLSKLRSGIVNEKVLASVAKSLKLEDLILVGKGEFKKNLHQQDPVLADTMEALLGQVYRHHGYAFTKSLFFKWLNHAVPDAFSMNQRNLFDAKSKLQEASLAKFKKLPRYTAEANDSGFEVKLWINDELMAQGSFPSKKGGEKELAIEVLSKKLI